MNVKYTPAEGDMVTLKGFNVRMLIINIDQHPNGTPYASCIWYGSTNHVQSMTVPLRHLEMATQH